MVVKVRTVLLFGTMMDLLSGNTKLFALKEVNEKGVTYEYTRGVHGGICFLWNSWINRITCMVKALCVPC